MITREQALAEITHLVQTHDITLDELNSALGKREVEANKKDASTLTRAFSYLGGIFVLAGLSTYVGMQWNQLNSAARIIITLGPGIVCLILAATMAMQLGQRPERRGSVTVLVILSALFQSTGLFVAVYELSTAGGEMDLAAFLIFGVLAFQYFIFFNKLKRTSLLFFSIYFSIGAFVSLCNLIHLPRNLTEFICGASILALSYGIQRTPYNSICGFGYFVGSVLLLWMGFDVIKDSSIEMLYLGIAAFMLYVSTIVNSRSMLITSALALFSYITYFTSQHFMHSVGWPISLIILGGVFFGISNLALKLNKKLVRSGAATAS